MPSFHRDVGRRQDPSSSPSPSLTLPDPSDQHHSPFSTVSSSPPSQSAATSVTIGPSRSSPAPSQRPSVTRHDPTVPPTTSDEAPTTPTTSSDSVLSVTIHAYTLPAGSPSLSSLLSSPSFMRGGHVNAASVFSQVPVTTSTSLCQGPSCLPQESPHVTFSSVANVAHGAPTGTPPPPPPTGLAGTSSGGTSEGGGDTPITGPTSKRFLIPILAPIFGTLIALALFALFFRRRKQKLLKQEPEFSQVKCLEHGLNAGDNYTLPVRRSTRTRVSMIGQPIMAPRRKPVPAFEEPQVPAPIANGGDKSNPSTLSWKVASPTSSALDLAELHKKWDQQARKGGHTPDSAGSGSHKQSRDSPFWDPADSEDEPGPSERGSVVSASSQRRETDVIPEDEEVSGWFGTTRDAPKRKDVSEWFGTASSVGGSRHKRYQSASGPGQRSPNRLSDASDRSPSSSSRSSTSIVFAPPSLDGHSPNSGGWYTPQGDDVQHDLPLGSPLSFGGFRTPFLAQEQGPNSRLTPLTLGNSSWTVGGSSSAQSSPRGFAPSTSGWPNNNSDRYR